jgi:glycolate oxidase
MNTVHENSEAFIKARQANLVKALRPHLPEHALLWEPEDTIPYECDGLAAYRQMPLAVALPETEAQAVEVIKVAKNYKFQLFLEVREQGCQVAPCRFPKVWFYHSPN